MGRSKRESALSISVLMKADDVRPGMATLTGVHCPLPVQEEVINGKPIIDAFLHLYYWTRHLDVLKKWSNKYAYGPSLQLAPISSVRNADVKLSPQKLPQGEVLL